MNEPTISLVRTAPDDSEVVSGLLWRLFDELDDGNGPALSQVKNSAARLLTDGLVTGVIAYDRGRPVGVLMLNECAAIYAGGRFGEITELYVAPEYRSRGIAPRLIEEAKIIASERGWVRLEVGAPDQPAWSRTLAFYLREGFENVGPRLRLLV